MEKIMNKSIFALFAVACISLTSCSETWTDGDFNGFSETKLIDYKTIKMEENDAHTPKQKAYILSTWDTIASFAKGRSDMSRPDGVKISLDHADDTYVQVSLNADFTNNYVFNIEDNANPRLYNLLTNKKYYYRTSNNLESFEGAGRSFTTSTLLPRNLYIGGITNVRDLGGYTSKLGGTIKQNMFIRGARLTQSNREPDHMITDYGLKLLCEWIGVKTELDLRSNDKGDDEFSETGGMDNTTIPELEYKNVPMSYFKGNDINLLETSKPQLKEIFKMYAVETNYPVYVHCSIGTDRTGVVSYLMGALLGMDNEDLHTDYLFSNFDNLKGNRTIADIEKRYYPTLKAYEKSTLQKCAEAYLLDIGVTQQEIDNIKSIMIEK